MQPTYGRDLSTGSNSVCYEPYTTFDERYRSESFGKGDNCDRCKVDGTSWYRFWLSAGENVVQDWCPRLWALIKEKENNDVPLMVRPGGFLELIKTYKDWL